METLICLDSDKSLKKENHELKLNVDGMEGTWLYTGNQGQYWVGGGGIKRAMRPSETH